MNYPDRFLRATASYSVLDVLLADIAIRIQLTATDYQAAIDHYNAINEWIDRPDSPLHGLVELFYTQGSFAIGATIARHSTDDEFDLDAMAQLGLPTNVDPERPLSLLMTAIRGEKGSRYYDMTDRKTRCVTVNYATMHLDTTPTVRLLAREERTGFIFHSKPEDPREPKFSLYANPFGFSDWFTRMTPADEAFGVFFEKRSLDYARARMLAKADADKVPDQLPAYRKSRAVIALQLIKRWRNLAYDNRHAALRRPPSILLAKYVADNANRTQGLADELTHQVNAMLAIVAAADQAGRPVFERNPACPEDILTDRWPRSLEDQKVLFGELRVFSAKLARLNQGAPLPEMQKILEELFGERPARAAVDRYIEEHEADRRTGQGIHIPRTGAIPALGSGIAAPSIARATPRNTFFGDGER
jgi:hypothetical protein